MLSSDSFQLTCAIGRGPDIGGQHLEAGLLVGLLGQALLHGLLQPPLHLQQLLPAQPQGLQDALALGVLHGQPVRHRRHHGRALAAAVPRAQEAHVAVGRQPPHHLVELAGEPVRRRWRREVWEKLTTTFYNNYECYQAYISIR